MYATVLLLSLQFKALVGFLDRDASTRAYRIDAPHVAIALLHHQATPPPSPHPLGRYPKPPIALMHHQKSAISYLQFPVCRGSLEEHQERRLFLPRCTNLWFSNVSPPLPPLLNSSRPLPQDTDLLHTVLAWLGVSDGGGGVGWVGGGSSSCKPLPPPLSHRHITPTGCLSCVLHTKHTPIPHAEASPVCAGDWTWGRGGRGVQAGCPARPCHPPLRPPVCRLRPGGGPGVLHAGRDGTGQRPAHQSHPAARAAHRVQRLWLPAGQWRLTWRLPPPPPPHLRSVISSSDSLKSSYLAICLASFQEQLPPPPLFPGHSIFEDGSASI